MNPKISDDEIEKLRLYEATGSVGLFIGIKALYTPEKPLYYKDLRINFCPRCHSVITNNNRYCSWCGQAIDWRDNELQSCSE